MRGLIHAGAAIWMATTGQAQAHPAFLSSAPQSGQTLTTAPKELRLRFSEPVELSFTKVALLDAAGAERQSNAPSAVEGDAQAVVVVMPALTSGAYKVRWSTVGRDGHRIKGEFSFTVK